MSTKSFVKPIIFVAGATALAGSLGGYIWREEHRPKVLEIYVFALKSGRSMFIRTPDDKRILVDGGSNSEIVRQISKILPFYSRRIDVVIATNTEGRNVAGLIDIIERYKFDRAYIPAYTLENLGIASSTDQIYQTFIDFLDGENIQIEQLQEGRIIYFDNKVKLTVNFPADPKIFSYSKSSAPEILFNISYGKNSFVFLGNATNKVQKYVASSTPSSFRSDVLIVSHSALSANISPLLIQKIDPAYLIYSKKVQATKVVKDDYTSISATTSKVKKKKEVIDPLKYLKVENRFNLKEKGTIKIVGDGEKVGIVVE